MMGGSGGFKGRLLSLPQTAPHTLWRIRDEAAPPGCGWVRSGCPTVASVARNVIKKIQAALCRAIAYQRVL